VSHTAARLLYKPVGMALGMGASALSGLAFRQVWRRISGTNATPDARSPEWDWAEVLLAAALQGAIYSAVRAAVDRAGAQGLGLAVGDWPTRHNREHEIHADDAHARR
jgi:hypothetical protein